MQNAKDTFYEVLRDRVAAGNAARTVVVRGVVRTGVIVEENEVAESAELQDCFRLRWTTVAVDAEGAAPLVTLGCEIRYSTKGAGATGVSPDRGRELAAMDAELRAALETAPQNAAKKSFAGLANGRAAVEMGSRIWWGDAVFGPAVMSGPEMQRVATVSVRSYAQQDGEEAGGA